MLIPGFRQHPPVTIELPHPVTSASLHPFLRDRFVAGSTKDPWVRVYDLDSGKEKEVYKGHHGPVLCASYSPDGEVYASGSEDGGFFLFFSLHLLLILSSPSSRLFLLSLLSLLHSKDFSRLLMSMTWGGGIENKSVRNELTTRDDTPVADESRQELRSVASGRVGRINSRCRLQRMYMHYLYGIPDITKSTLETGRWVQD
jgi:WD40 repeat protein